MTPQIKYDYSQREKLETILKDKRLQDGQYGHPSQKRVRLLNLSTKEIFSTTSGFLRMLLGKYGNQPFSDAYQQYKQDGRK